MKRLIVCCDGTWNNPEQNVNGIPTPTNVFKLSNSVADSGNNNVQQQVYYHPGIGGEGGFFRTITGGAYGNGISRHICSGYHWLGSLYEEGDEIFLYGFSRGAFTVRSLAGFIGAGGLLNLRGLESEESWERVHTAYDKGYRMEGVLRSDWAEADWLFYDQPHGTFIHFIGVWETVGALGVPDDLEILNFLDNKKKWQFHNTTLNAKIKTARHAMAIDEMRSSFCVSRWNNREKDRDVKEMWFPGVHSDVGGGYAQNDLSNGALLWMMEESEKAGLVFRDGIKEGIQDEPSGIMHNSFCGAFKALRSRPRNVDAICKEKSVLFHPSVFLRQKNTPIEYPPYRPTRLLEPGESIAVDIYASTLWNETGLYLPKDQSFVFSSTGKWKDSRDSCDWLGTQDGKRTLGDMIRAIGSFIGFFEKAYRKLTKNENTDILFTKRVERLPWFVLVGAIANDAGVSEVVENDGTPVAHQYVQLSEHQEGKPLRITNPGYLYCFANDVWTLYKNNRGSVRVTVTRIQ